MADENQKSGYGKRPLWQWILIYVVVGGIIYFAIYKFFLKGNYSYSGNSYTPQSSSYTAPPPPASTVPTAMPSSQPNTTNQTPSQQNPPQRVPGY